MDRAWFSLAGVPPCGLSIHSHGWGFERMLPLYLGSRWEGFELATFQDLVGSDKSNDLDHFAK